MTKRAVRRLGFGVGATILLFPAATAFAATPTPTPRPKLSGGFGRPRATPSVPSDGGQSLADVVRAAGETRNPTKEKERGSVMIDNRSLVTNPDKGRVSTSRALPSAPTPVPAAAPGPEAAPPELSPGDSPTGGSEAEWQETAARARKRVVDGKARAGELEAAARKLENDFYAWDDGQYRDRVIKPAWDRTREQLEEARRELADAERELAELPERARRAGAPPGWIRE